MKTTMKPIEDVLGAIDCEEAPTGEPLPGVEDTPVLTTGFLQFLAEKLKESKKEPFRFQDQAYLGIDYGREESQTVVFRTGRASEKSTTVAARAIDMDGEPLYRDLWVDPLERYPLLARPGK